MGDKDPLGGDGRAASSGLWINGCTLDRAKGAVRLGDDRLVWFGWSLFALCLLQKSVLLPNYLAGAVFQYDIK